jgi:antitoxin (DNA-binding transcriptional repressor) of toxin-antitoxin stability system
VRRVGVREFRDKATQYLAGGEPLVVERHGRPIGFYIPATARRDEELREALKRLEEAVEQVLEESGLTEEELSQAFDLRHKA